MGEHKLRIESGDGEPRKLSTHIVEVIDVPAPTFDDNGLTPLAIEAAYERIAVRAKYDDSFILNVVQSIDVYTRLNTATNLYEARMIVTIVAQRVSREELEKQQRLQRMGGR